MNLNQKIKNKMLKKSIFFAAFFAIAALLSSCFVDYGLDTNNYDLVITNYNPDYNFGQVTKFDFIDSVVHMGEDEISHAYDQQIKDKVLSELADLGWQRVYDSTANVTIMLGTTSSTTTVYGSSSWWDYYGWYGGWGFYSFFCPGDNVGYSHSSTN